MTDTKPTQYMLTTVDNPFNPFTMFDEWYGIRYECGYNTLSFLARIARVSDDLPEPDQALATRSYRRNRARECFRNVA